MDPDPDLSPGEGERSQQHCREPKARFTFVRLGGGGQRAGSASPPFRERGENLSAFTRKVLGALEAGPSCCRTAGPARSTGGARWRASSSSLAGGPESPAFDAGALEDLKGLGLNTARVGFLWSRYETAPGQWNETYLGQVEGMLDQLRDHGMYAILDMHQDQMR